MSPFLALFFLLARGANGVCEMPASALTSVTTSYGRGINDQPSSYGTTDGQGTSANIEGPGFVAVSSGGTIYVSQGDYHVIRAISPTGFVSTLAGQSGVTNCDATSVAAGGYSCSTTVDGVGTNAHFSQPRGVAVNSAGTVYVADRGDNKIRAITPTGVVSTLAGGGREGVTCTSNNPGLGSCIYCCAGFNDGTGTSALFTEPKGVTVDAAGNVITTDSSNRIRKITPVGVVTTVAGGGVGGTTSGMANGVGTNALFSTVVNGLTVSSSNIIYVADTGNNLIRAVASASGTVTTLAGQATAGTGNNNGVGTNARFDYPLGLAIDSLGILFVGDSNNNVIKAIETVTQAVSLYAGGGSSGTDSCANRGLFCNGPSLNGALFSFSGTGGGVAISCGIMYVADYGNNALRTIAVASNTPTISVSPTVTPSAPRTPSNSPTIQETPSVTQSSTASPSPTESPSMITTSSDTSSPTPTLTDSPSAGSSGSDSPTPSATTTATATTSPLATGLDRGGALSASSGALSQGAIGGAVFGGLAALVVFTFAALFCTVWKTRFGFLASRSRVTRAVPRKGTVADIPMHSSESTANELSPAFTENPIPLDRALQNALAVLSSADDLENETDQANFQGVSPLASKLALRKAAQRAAEQLLQALEDDDALDDSNTHVDGSMSGADGGDAPTFSVTMMNPISARQAAAASAGATQAALSPHQKSAALAPSADAPMLGSEPVEYDLQRENPLLAARRAAKEAARQMLLALREVEAEALPFTPLSYESPLPRQQMIKRSAAPSHLQPAQRGWDDSSIPTNENPLKNSPKKKALQRTAVRNAVQQSMAFLREQHNSGGAAPAREFVDDDGNAAFMHNPLGARSGHQALPVANSSVGAPPRSPSLARSTSPFEVSQPPPQPALPVVPPLARRPLTQAAHGAALFDGDMLATQRNPLRR